MNPALNQIRKSLCEELELYEKTFRRIMASNIRLVDRIAKYIVRHKGKGLRPLLVILSAKLAGKPTENTYIVASLIEILHTATLVHDDVVDNAHIRRNFPSINAIWRNKVSVLMGDYLLAKSLISATETGSLEIMHILAQTSKRLSKGELFQIEKSRRLNITEEEYFQLISDKTAALLSACCELGAITVGATERNRSSLTSYGEYLGLAFQITDDLLDYQSSAPVLGKPVGSDLKEKKITLPLILALNKASRDEKKVIIHMIKKGVDSRNIKKIIAFCEKYNGIQDAGLRTKELAEKAKSEIAYLPDSPEKENAINFVDYIVDRKK
jgi:octaprenyl-diphosphate synthase